MRNETINLPVDFCIHVINERCVNQARTFVYLKYTSSGNINLNIINKKKILSELRIRKWETVDRHLKWLIQKGWMNERFGAYNLKSYALICNEIGINFSRGALFDPPNFEKKHFKAFLISAVLVFQFGRKKWLQRKFRNKSIAVKENQDLIPDIIKLNVECFYAANDYVARLTGVSKTSGHNYKILARKAGFIKLRKTYEEIKLPKSLRNKDVIKAADDDIGNRIVERNGKLFIQLPDRIIGTNIRFRINRSLLNLKRKLNTDL